MFKQHSLVLPASHPDMFDPVRAWKLNIAKACLCPNLVKELGTQMLLSVSDPDVTYFFGGFFNSCYDLNSLQICKLEVFDI